jgi:hypothetical protein
LAQDISEYSNVRGRFVFEIKVIVADFNASSKGKLPRELCVQQEPFHENHLLIRDEVPDGKQIRFALMRYGSTPDGFVFFLRGLFGFDNPAAQDQAFTILRASMAFEIELNDGHIAQELITVLFEKEFVNSRYAISVLQTLAAIHLYPTHCPRFWYELLEWPGTFACDFVRAFSDGCARLQFPVERTNSVLAWMLEDGSQQALLSFFLEKSPLCPVHFAVLRYLCEWIDKSLTFRDEMFEFVLSVGGGCGGDSVAVLTAILSGQIEKSILAEQLARLRLPERFVCQTESDRFAISEFVRKIVGPLTEFPVALTYLPICIELLLTADSRVATNIAQYFVTVLDQAVELDRQTVFRVVLETLYRSIEGHRDSLTVECWMALGM